MFGELPKLFGREFAIGFLLPTAVFIPASLLVAAGFTDPSIQRIVNYLPRLEDQKALLGATVFIFLLWLGAVTLLALNRIVVRVKEGYGRHNPALALFPIQRRRFRKLNRQLEDLDNQYRDLDQIGRALPPSQMQQRNTLARTLAEEFPHDENYLLPTAFGNAIRAFEVYSSTMYGLDAIPAWPRLLFVMPEESRSLVDTAKSQMDFWLNLWFLSITLLAEYIVLAFVTREFGSLWASLAVPAALIASNRAKAAAISWGEIVKAAFDIYLPELRKKLEIPSHLDRELDRDQWRSVSAAMIYRLPATLPPRKAEKAVDSQAEEDK